MLKAIAKALVNYVLAVAAPIVWYFGRDKLLVLTYHRVLPRSAADDHSIEPGMFVFEDTFEMHLRTLKEHFEIVDLAEWLKAEKKPAKRCCAITFDDGWRDNYDYAFPLLKKHQASATIFVVSGLMGTDARFWPDRLGSALVHLCTKPQSVDTSDDSVAWLIQLQRAADISTSSFSREDVSRAVQIAKRMEARDVENHLDRLEDLGFSSTDRVAPDLLGWEQLEQMVASGLVTIGSHTRRHTRLLDNVPEADLRTEIIQSKNDIEDAIGAQVYVFCYPNGDKNKLAEKLVREHYHAACTISEHWNRPDTGVFNIGRMTMHEDGSNTRPALLARITGLV